MQRIQGKGSGRRDQRESEDRGRHRQDQHGHHDGAAGAGQELQGHRRVVRGRVRTGESRGGEGRGGGRERLQGRDRRVGGLQAPEGRADRWTRSRRRRCAPCAAWRPAGARSAPSGRRAHGSAGGVIFPSEKGRRSAPPFLNCRRDRGLFRQRKF